jgi:FKBP-type peptidyl-prolyl cis-trans isomerase FkpA
MRVGQRSSVFVFFSLCAVSALAASACENSNPSSPSVNVPFSTTDLAVGTGTEATVGRTITVNYTGWLYSAAASDNKGAQFDTTSGRGPYQLILGVGQVIRGWDQGLVGMRAGGRRRLVIPPNLGYGTVANGPIPANSTLLFEVELLSVQ